MERKYSGGYTLIEFMITLAIITIVATIVLFGLNLNSDNDKIDKAQKDLIVYLRSIQNKVNNGGTGENYSDIDFTEIRSAINLPEDLYIYIGDPAYDYHICFSHPNFEVYKGTDHCGACSGAAFFVCKDTTYYDSGTFKIIIENEDGSISKCVDVQGTGMNINSINANNDCT